jgi:hypothetical protein
VSGRHGVPVVLVPSTPALLPAYQGLEDAVPELRRACRDAVDWLVAQEPRRILVVATSSRHDNRARGAAQPPGLRIAQALLAETDWRGELEWTLTRSPTGSDGVIVVGNGSGTRVEKTPGPLDDSASAFDDRIEGALNGGALASLAGLDDALGERLWCHDVPALQWLGELAEGRGVDGGLDHVDDPYGVRYWVGRWRLTSR